MWEWPLSECGSGHCLNVGVAIAECGSGHCLNVGVVIV